MYSCQQKIAKSPGSTGIFYRGFLKNFSQSSLMNLLISLYKFRYCKWKPIEVSRKGKAPPQESGKGRVFPSCPVRYVANSGRLSRNQGKFLYLTGSNRWQFLTVSSPRAVTHTTLFALNMNPHPFWWAKNVKNRDGFLFI